MQRFARLAGDRVIAIDELEDGIDVATRFHPAYVATLVPIGADVAEGWTREGEAWTAPAPPELPPPDLVAYAAWRRWQVETAGITVAGHAIRTDRESQALITGAYVYAQQDPQSAISFKAEKGFVTLPAADVATIAQAVALHVQFCFSVERAVLTAIETGAITDIAGVDAADWPPTA